MEVVEGLGAVVEEIGAPVRVEPILVEEPGPGEVLVRLEASGVCHSDHWAIANGNWGAPFPMLLGHEGAGVVQKAGEGVDHRPGDRVLLAWAVPCGECPPCLMGAPRACTHAWAQPPRVRIARTGARLVGTLSLGTLATHTVVNAKQALPVPAAGDLSRICLLGCAVSTGVGAAVNTAAVRPGSSVAVIGLGGIGLAALQGARIAGAERLIAIDLVAEKFDWARAMGATDVIDASAGDPVAAVRALTDGVDAAFEATGVPSVVSQAVAMLSRGGVAVAIGVPPPDSTVTLDWSGGGGGAYPTKVSLRITDGGDALVEDFATWMDWAVDGRLNIDSMVTREASLTEADIAESFRAMLAGEVVRTVIRIDASG